MSWRDQAACHGEDPELWFPPERVDQRGTDDPNSRTSIALAICAECPVATQCLDATLEEESTSAGRYGIRGGLLAHQRADLVRATRECVECGQRFPATRANRATCSSRCAHVRHNRTRREWSRRKARA